MKRIAFNLDVIHTNEELFYTEVGEVVSEMTFKLEESLDTIIESIRLDQFERMLQII